MAKGRPVPVALGYAVYSSNSGHDASANPGNPAAFALNAEARKNFSYAALKKTRDAALFLIEKRYGRAPKWRYVIGGSSGGREALAVAQKWPEDFDGVVAMYPAFAAASLDLQFGRITRALALPGAYLNQAKRKVLFDAAMQACDGLDGLVDGIVSNQAACNAKFHPETATLAGQPIRCVDGKDTADTCLSDAQLAAVKVINTPAVFRFQSGRGERSYPGFNIYGSDFGNPGNNPAEVNAIFLGLGSQVPVSSPMPQPSYGPDSGVPYEAAFWDQWTRYFVTGDPNFNSMTVDPENPGRWTHKILALMAEQDVVDPDLARFAAHGGKLIVEHGTADPLVSTRATDAYVAKVRSRMGRRTAAFMRYYQVPGQSHGSNPAFNPAWDSLTALDNWVSGGTPPVNLTVMDMTGVPGRTRPMCDYPTWPRYNGSGAPNLAASFTCSTR